jgi:hypothetical protein
MYNLFQQNPTHTKRILAHRQTWFENNSMNMTTSQKTQASNILKVGIKMLSQGGVTHIQQQSQIFQYLI